MENKKPIIKASTPNSKKYDTKIDVYTNDPREEHKTIHIAINSNDKSAHIIDTTNGNTEHTDVKCFITTACMKQMEENFNDNCFELTKLRWFKDNFVSQEDIKHYYEIAPIIVENINSMANCKKIYLWIYNLLVKPCIEAINHKDYVFAHSRYKDIVLMLENEFVFDVPTKQDKVKKLIKS